MAFYITLFSQNRCVVCSTKLFTNPGFFLIATQVRFVEIASVIRWEHLSDYHTHIYLRSNRNMYARIHEQGREHDVENFATINSRI
jgi:hypothetical protein